MHRIKNQNASENSDPCVPFLGNNLKPVYPKLSVVLAADEELMDEWSGILKGKLIIRFLSYGDI